MKAPLPQVELDYNQNTDESEYKAKNPCKNSTLGCSPKTEKTLKVFVMSITTSKHKYFSVFPEFWENDIYSANVPNLLKQWDRCIILENF